MGKYVAIVPEASRVGLPSPSISKERLDLLSRLGFTVDSKENVLLRKLHPDLPSGRYDRILVNSEGQFWDRLKGIKMFGKVLVEGSKDMFPSTHYGISAKIESAALDGPIEEGSCVIS